jgi:hypothetical protein
MSLTLLQSPYLYTPIKQKLIFVASSTQVGQTGFRFVIEVNDGQNVQTFYIQPNPQGVLVFDIYPVIKDWMTLDLNDTGGMLNIFKATTCELYQIDHNINDVRVKIWEGWNVLGVFTVDPNGVGALDQRSSFFNGAFQSYLQFSPDPTQFYALTSNVKDVMTDLTQDTFNLSNLISQYSLGATTVGVLAYETDYGVVTVPTDDGARLTGNLIDEIQIVQFNSAGAPIQTDTFSITATEATLTHAPLYPANINSTFGLAANWHHYLCSFKASGSPTARGLAFFQQEPECRFDVVRLGWTNSRGGWDFWNFTKRSEENYSIQRKRFRKLQGNYAEADGSTTPFTFFNYDRGLTERTPFVEKMTTVSTDYLNEAQFEFLKTLAYSESVYIINTNGEAEPVVIEQNSFNTPKPKGYMKQGMTIQFTLKHSNDWQA